MTHTKGPWKVAENLFGNTVSYEVYANVETKSGKGGYTRICQITPRDQKANAHLIAAAPEMRKTIESLLAVLDVFVAYNTYFPLGDGIVSEALRDAREVAKRAGSDDYGEEYADES